MNEKATTEIYDSWDVDVPTLIRNTLLKNKVYSPEDLEAASLGLKKGGKFEQVQKLKRDLGFDLLEPFNYYTWPVDVDSLIHTTLSDNNVGVPSDLEAAEINITSGSKKHRLLLELRKSLGFSDGKTAHFRDDLPVTLRSVSWKEAELKVNPRIKRILERYQLETIEDIASFLDLESVTCPDTGKTHDVSGISNFGGSSFGQLKEEFKRLCELGLDGYRNDGLQNVSTPADLINSIGEKLSDGEKEIFTSHETGSVLAKKLSVSTAHITQTRTRIEQRITASEREKAREFLNRCWGPRGTRIAVPINEAVAMTGAEHENELRLLREISGADFFWDKKAEVLFKVTKQRRQEIEDELNRIGSSEIQFNQDGIFNFQQRNGLEQEINREEFRFLLRAKRIAGEYKSQLSNELTGGRIASSNGVDFTLLRPSGLFSDANTLVAFLNENLKKDFDISPSGSVRGVTQHTTRSDDAVRVLKDAEGALTKQEIKDRVKDRTNYDWPITHLSNELNDRLESVLTKGGHYIHIENVGLTYGKVKVLSKWAEQKLLNKNGPTSFEELFEEYKTAHKLPHIENAYQLASCALKHPKVKRPSRAKELFHAESHEGNQRWYPTKIREFVKDLLPNIDSFDPSERQAIFAHSGISNTTGKHVEFLNNFCSGSLPREAIEDFSKGKDEVSEADISSDTTEALGELTEKDNEEIGEVETEALTSAADANDESNPVASLPSVSTTDALAAMDNKIVQSTDGETAEFLIEKAKAKIWRHAYIDEAQASEELRKYNTEGEYSQRVKREFQSEYDSAKSLVIPDGYSFQVDGKIAQPNLMQRHVASKVKQLRRFGNWSGTGAGKTLSAILATRVTNSRLTVICCPNAVVGDDNNGWVNAIKAIYPDSEVQSKTFEPVWKSKNSFKYLVLNYEKFQQPDSETKVKTFVETNNIDFVVIDEIHFVKQRSGSSKREQKESDQNVSKRRRLVQKMTIASSKKTANMCVLGMSATPVINDLREGISLIEMISGEEHDDLEHRATLKNCNRLHQKLVAHGTRWKPNYKIGFETLYPEVDCAGFVEDVRELGPKATPLAVEQILTRARLPEILKHLSRDKPTIIYSYFVREIDEVLRKAVLDADLTAGFYTGKHKGGLELFKQGKIDVLIASGAIGTGVDGLQKCCSQLIINVLPWTNAEYEQLIGRIWRQGQVDESVQVIIPVTGAVVCGELWSYCQSKLDRINYKKTVADAVVDGEVPEGRLRTAAQANRDVLSWLERLSEGETHAITRRKIEVPLSDEATEVKRRLGRYGDFPQMNRTWNSSRSSTLAEKLKKDPEQWYNYHTLYRQAREDWTVVPFQEMIRWCQSRPRKSIVVGDFGCGENLLMQGLEGHQTVHAFDHVAINDQVTACDMSSVSIEDETLDIAVFCLSLMGANFTDYVREAHRTLKVDGTLHIWEATSRFGNVDMFLRGLSRLGFRPFPAEEKGSFTHIQARKEPFAPSQDVKLAFGGVG